MQKQQNIHSQPLKTTEHILVIDRDHLFAQIPAWQGIRTNNYTSLTQTIMHHKQLLPRPLAEHNPQYKQIIPYLVLRYHDQLFVIQRRADATEQRLANRLSIGIGGHIRASDVTTADPFMWAQRELAEEIAGAQVIQHTFIGFINDDANQVGTVHFGIAYGVQLANPMITVNSELKHGRWLTENTMPALDHFEPWSQLTLQLLLHA